MTADDLSTAVAADEAVIAAEKLLYNGRGDSGDYLGHPEWLDAYRDAVIAAVQRTRAEQEPPRFDPDFLSKPCTRCGAGRNWSLAGHLQAVCYACGHPAPSERIEPNNVATDQERELAHLKSSYAPLHDELSRLRADVTMLEYQNVVDKTDWPPEATGA